MIATDSPSTLSALNGDLIYPLKRHGKYVCMRRVDGKVSRATRVPGRSCGAGDLGLDGQGRVVYPFAIYRMKKGVRVSARWFLYDLKRDRARRVKGLPGGGCLVDSVLVWRSRTVYGTSCPSKSRTGLWVKQGKKRRRIVASTNAILDLTFRGGALAAIAYTGPLDDSEGIVQLMVGGKPCVRKLETTVAEGDHTWSTGNVWIANGRIVWTMGVWLASPSLRDFALLAAKLPSGCSAPGPTGRFDFAPETGTLRSLAVDGGEVFYAGDDGIRSHTLPSQPSHAPPPNDDFENAQSVTVNGPTPSGSTAWATAQPGEPLTNATQTVWYTFIPTTSGTVYASAYGRGGEFAVYRGTGLGTLTPVAGPTSMYNVYTQVDVVAGEKYWIDVGTTDPEPNYAPFAVRVATTRPAG